MGQSLRERYGPWALVAGGSEGIGFEFARLLAAEDINLLLVARREQPLSKARERILQDFPVDVRCHSLDLSARELERDLDKLIADIEVGLLVYNAGATHGAGLFLDEPLEKSRRLVSLNCDAPVVLCHSLGRAMRSRGRGGILLMSSMSGLTGGAYIATYTATKSFDIVFAESLWAELKPYGVDVLGLIAGATDTPAMRESGVALGDSAMSPAAVAAEGLAALAEGPLHVAGDSNREFAAMLRSEDRRNTIDLMSQGAASMYGRPYPLKPL
jgi:short-subunit dehydrogenase